ncbi:hypothetical protein Tco_1419989 [Tanacetum coccineum]
MYVKSWSIDLVPTSASWEHDERQVKLSWDSFEDHIDSSLLQLPRDHLQISVPPVQHMFVEEFLDFVSCHSKLVSSFFRYSLASYM